jgi:hypothetical protein
MKELFEFVVEWPKQQKKAGEVYGGIFVLISLTVVFVVMVLSRKAPWEALTSSGPWLGLLVIVLYNVGSGLDPIFDTVFNPSMDFYVSGKQGYFPLNPLGKKMRVARMRAARFLLEGNKGTPEEKAKQKPLSTEEVKGIYRKAKILYEDSCAWKENVQGPLAFSKAVRSVIIPVALVFAYYFIAHVLPRHTLAPHWPLELKNYWSELSTDLVFCLFRKVSA